MNRFLKNTFLFLGFTILVHLSSFSQTDSTSVKKDTTKLRYNFNSLQKGGLFLDDLAKKTIIFTTHFTRKLEGLVVKKPTFQIRFKGIDKALLRQLVTKRLQFISSELTEELIISDLELEQLIAQYGDNYRGIVNHLYDKFQDYG